MSNEIKDDFGKMEIIDVEDIWNKLSYEQRLAATAYIFKKITSGEQSFRHLIYDKLGFNTDAYVLLFGEGGMTITNAMFEYYRKNKGD